MVQWNFYYNHIKVFNDDYVIKYCIDQSDILKQKCSVSGFVHGHGRVYL